MGLSAMFAMSVTSQTSIRIKNTGLRPEGVNASKNSTPLSVNQVYGNVVCNTIYVAGTTMNLEFKFTQTGPNTEWIDMFTLTFPAGITPNSSPNSIFPSAGPGGAPVTTATLNPIAGQDISWGAAIQSTWGAIHTAIGVGQTFTVNVTIAPGTTGTQMANYVATADTYTLAGNPVSGDLTGMVNMYDTPFSNIYAKLVQPNGGGYTGIQNCGMATSTVAARYVNVGTKPESNINLNYSVNGVAGTAGTYTGTIVPGDSITIGLGTYDFSANNVYDMKAWSQVAGDIDMTNDTAFYSISNSNSVLLTSATYSNSIESVYDFGSIYKTWSGSGLPFDIDHTEMHSGLTSLGWTIATGNTVGTYTATNIFPCMDVVAGEVYRISYWRETLAGNVGMSAITTGTTNSTAGTSTILKAYSTITPGAAWAKDSVDYTAAITGTRYFSIRGKGTITALIGANVIIDDVKIWKVSGSVGIKTNSSAEAISIFPNPTSGILNINAIEVTSSVEVYNVIGDKVYSGTLVKGNNSVDLSSLANGAYFVKLNSNNQITSKKVILSK
jgi:hypothetical protein